MRTHRLVVPILALAGTAGLALAARTDLATAKAPADPDVRSFELTYRAVVTGLPAGARRVDVWIPYPHSDENQRIEVLAVEAPTRYQVSTEPRFGNRVLHLSVARPQQPFTLELRARVERREVVRKELSRAAAHGRPERDPALAKWLAADRLVPLDARIRSLAAEVTAGAKTDVAKARAIYDYVVDTMSYDKSGTGWGNGDIYWACDKKRGNCTDFHALFTGLTRAAGIPAKFAIGLPLPPARGEGQIPGYHCWAEFWLDGVGWVPVDTSEARKHPEKREYFFGDHDPDRVELSEGRDLVLRPAQQGAPLNYFVYPYVEVDGKPHAGVEQTFAYRDLPAAAATAATAR
ncbi:MAG TPA: transglutaminase domain-containing protein [Thermoanaerobaculia bacterium]|nr:transglutaminase domain-containing protein [Thermoanaerobaculia bacterium]